jgi:glutaminyl-tRNA synthetase
MGELKRLLTVDSLQAVDSDSTDEKVILNRIVSLKEDVGKK